MVAMPARGGLNEGTDFEEIGLQPLHGGDNKNAATGLQKCWPQPSRYWIKLGWQWFAVVCQCMAAPVVFLHSICLH